MGRMATGGSSLVWSGLRIVSPTGHTDIGMRVRARRNALGLCQECADAPRRGVLLRTARRCTGFGRVITPGPRTGASTTLAFFLPIM